MIPPKVYQLLVQQDPQELKAHTPPKPGKRPGRRPNHYTPKQRKSQALEKGGKELETMDITVKHEAPDFFGALQYAEDQKINVNFSDLKKVFAYLKSHYNIGVEIDKYVLFWDTMQNFQYGLLSCKEYDAKNSYKEYEWDFDGCKKFFYSLIKNQ